MNLRGFLSSFHAFKPLVAAQPILKSMLLLAFVVVSGCGGSNSKTPTTATLSSIAVTPATASISIGAAQQYVATGTYSDGSTKDLSGTATWSSSATSVATISSAGLATGLAAGPTTIAAAASGVSGTATLTVNAFLKSIAVTPAAVSIAIGAAQQFTATGTYSDGSTKDLSGTATWSSSTASVATISSVGLATGVAAGSTTIAAAVAGVSGTATLTVNPSLKSIAVTPATVSIAIAATQQFTATGTYSDGTTKNLTSIAAWSSSTATVATITASGGLATAVANGAATITATVSGISGTAALTVAAPQVTVQKQVVDTQFTRPLAGLVITFTAGSTSVSATTSNHGIFTVTLAPGLYTLTIQQGIKTLLTGTATVGVDGSITEYPTTIPVQLPANPIATFLKTSTPIVAALSVIPDTPISGQNVTVGYKDATATATAVSVAFAGSGCGALVSAQMNGPTYQQVAAVGDAGTCQVTTTVTFPSGPQTFTTQFKVEPSTVTLPALSILGSSFIPGDALPAAVNQTAATSITSVTPPGTLINGATERFVVVPGGEPTGAKIISFLVQIAGGTGYFSVPAKQDTSGNYYFDLVLNQDYFTTNTEPAFAREHRDIARRINTSLLTKHGRIGAAATGAADAGTTLDVNVEATDSQGNISTEMANATATQQVGSGSLQISLSWDALVDLDLHVVEPDSEEIYYGNQVATDGGTLDLDSNPACNIDGINNENVTWPSPHVPTPTTGSQQYIVRVDYYEACPDQSVNYQVTVNNCSAVSQFSGSFTAADADGGAQGAGLTITSFPYTACNGSTVSGRATYDDYQASVTGLSTTPNPLPIRDATIKVRAETDASVLQTGSTDDNGNFNLTFTNGTGTPGYYLTIDAASPATDATVVQQVTDHSGSVYTFQSPFYNETMTPNNTGLTLDAALEQGAPAFNIYDQGVSAFRFISPFIAGTGAPKMLTWYWQSGEDSPDCPGASCWFADEKRIDIKSIETDPNEYFDSVLLHEFGHFFQYYYGSQNNPGGAHGFTRRYTPTMAWSEGFASFFGQTVKGSPDYLDVYADGTCVCADLDVPLASDIPLGTENSAGAIPGDQTGFLSEILVASGLYNLEKEVGTIPVFVSQSDMVVLTSTAASTRDVAGYDFVDFLDTYGCLDNPRGTAATGEQALINGTLQFPYDYAAPCLTTPSTQAQLRPQATPSANGSANRIHRKADDSELQLARAAKARRAALIPKR